MIIYRCGEVIVVRCEVDEWGHSVEASHSLPDLHHSICTLLAMFSRGLTTMMRLLWLRFVLEWLEVKKTWEFVENPVSGSSSRFEQVENGLHWTGTCENVPEQDKGFNTEVWQRSRSCAWSGECFISLKNLFWRKNSWKWKFFPDSGRYRNRRILRQRYCSSWSQRRRFERYSRQSSYLYVLYWNLDVFMIILAFFLSILMFSCLFLSFQSNS